MVNNDSNNPSDGGAGDQTPPPYSNESADAPPPYPGDSAPPLDDSPPPLSTGGGGTPGGTAGAGSPLSEADSKMWGMLAHLLGILAAFVAPLVIMLVFGPRSASVEKHAKEALNFQIIVTIAYVVSMFATLVPCVGLLVFPAVFIANLILCIIAGLEANKGNDYKYPFNHPFVK